MGSNLSDESIGNSFRRRLRAIGIAAPVEAAYICQQVDTLADGRFRSISYRNNTLTIRASNTLIAHELRLTVDELRRAILIKLNWPTERILRIRVVS